MRVSSLIGDSLNVTLRHPRLWVFGLFAAAGGASVSGESGGEGAEAAAHTAADSGAANELAGVASDVAASEAVQSMQQLPAALEGFATHAATVGELFAANLPFVIAGAAVLGLGVMALHIVAEGALIEGVSRKHRDPSESFTIRGGLRLGLSHFGAVLGVKALALLLGLLLASAVGAPFALAGVGVLPIGAAIALGLPLALVAIPLGISIYLIYSLGLRVAVLENRRVVDSLKRARRLLHGRLLDGLKILLTVGVGGVAAKFIAAPVAIPVVMAAGLGFLLGGWVGTVVALITLAAPLALVGAGLLGCWTSSVWTIGYLATAQDGARA
jgi:hypothetical protein